MVAHPIESVVVDATQVGKAAFRAYVKARTRLFVVDAAEANGTDLTGQTGGIYVGDLAADFDFVAGDTTTADDGYYWLVDDVGNRFRRRERSGRALTVYSADFSVAAEDRHAINDKAGSGCVVTLPAAADHAERRITLTNHQAQTLASATSNVVPRAGGAAGTAILSAAAGAWAELVSDGTNWLIVAGS